MSKDIHFIFEENIGDEKETLPLFIRQQLPNQAEFQYFDLVNLSEDKIVFQKKLIKEITVFECYYNNQEWKFLYIRFEDGSTTVRTVKDALYKLLLLKWREENPIRYMAIVAFKKRNQPLEDKWDKSVKEWYSLEVDEFYAILHDDLIKYLFSIPELTKEANVNIIDGGCGDGRFFVKLSKKIKQELPVKSIQFYGFDSNDKNIQQCKKKQSEEHDHLFTHCVFRENNLSKIGDFLQEIKIKEEKAINIVTLSGSITRDVSKNGFKALTCLQQIAENGIDYIVGGGREAPIITDFIARQLGYETIFLRNYIPGNFFSYYKVSEEKIFNLKQDEIKKENFLDLSLSPNPISILSKLSDDDWATIAVIDLSFCCMSDQLIEYLDEKIMAKNKNIKLIFWHYDQAMIDNFEYRFNLTRQLNLATEIVEDDIYLISKRRFCELKLQ